MQKLMQLMALSAGILISSCAEKKSTVTQNEGISGRYINKTVLDQTTNLLKGTVPEYCFELNFISNNSVSVFYGFEETKLGYKKDGDQYKLLKASRYGDMSFVLNNDGSISLKDSLWTKIPSASTFIKVRKINGKKWVFDYYLNDQLIAGAYSLYDQNKATGQKVVFTPNGNINGLSNYKKYSLCYSGDCVGITQPASNIITMVSSDLKKEDFSFTIDKNKNRLKIFKLGEPIKDIKGEISIKEMIFDLRQ